jgi:hypothetical protein
MGRQGFDPDDLVVRLAYRAFEFGRIGHKPLITPESQIRPLKLSRAFV